MTGDDRAKMAALPHTTGLMKNAFIARRFSRRRDPTGGEYTHWGYAHAVRAAGGIFVEVGDDGGVTREQFEAAFRPDTAGVYWTSDGAEPGIPLAEVVASQPRPWRPGPDRCIEYRVPAGGTPPRIHRTRRRSRRFFRREGVRGPQGSGFLTGRADLIRAARMQGAPIQGIGRPLKVSKEEIIGLLTAIDIWVNRDHAADLRDARRRTARVVEALPGLPGIHTEHRFPDHIGRPYPTAFIRIDPATGLTALRSSPRCSPVIRQSR